MKQMTRKFFIPIFILCVSCTLAAQEKNSSQNEYDQFKWTPPTEKVFQLRFAGELSSGDEEFPVKAPGAMVGKFGKLYVYDKVTGQALLFNADGSFLCPLFAHGDTIGGRSSHKYIEDRKVVAERMEYPWISNIDVDITGRILFNSRISYFLLDGQLWLFPQKRRYGWFKAVLWNNRIYTNEILYPDNVEAHYLLSEYSLSGKKIRTIEIHERVLGSFDLAVDDGILYSIGSHENKIWKINICEKTKEVLTIDIPALSRRIERNLSPGNTRYPYTEPRRDQPVFEDIEVSGGKIYLLIPNSHRFFPPEEGKHYLIGVFDENGTFKRAFSLILKRNYQLLEMSIFDTETDRRVYCRIRDRTDWESERRKSGGRYFDKTKILKYVAEDN